MKLGIDSYSYHLHLGRYEYKPSQPKTVDWFLEHAAELGVDGVMILELDRDTPDSRLQEIRQKARTLGLYLELGGGGVRPEDAQADLRMAHTLSARVLKLGFRLDLYSGKVPLWDQMQRVIDDLRESADLARQLDVRIALENHGHWTADQGLYIVEAVKSDYVGFCLDTGNSLMVLEDPIATAAKMAPYAFTTHFKDASFGGTYYGAEILHVGLGRGVLGLSLIFNIIKATAPDPNINLEVVSAPQATEEETLAFEEQTVVDSIRYAREVLGIV
jgi:sugar phosphate isomerase/epimerase